MSAAVKPIAIAEQVDRTPSGDVESPSSRLEREAQAEHDDWKHLSSVELRQLATNDPAEAIVEATRYMHQKQERLRAARVKLVQLVATHATANGSPPASAVPGGPEAMRAMNMADAAYRLALRDWAQLIVLMRLGPRE